MNIFGRYLDINNLRSSEFLRNHLGGVRGVKKKWRQHHIIIFSQKHHSALTALSSHFQNGLQRYFISGTLLWAVGVPPKPLIQLLHWLNCSVNKKSKIFLQCFMKLLRKICNTWGRSSPILTHGLQTCNFSNYAALNNSCLHSLVHTLLQACAKPRVV